MMSAKQREEGDSISRCGKIEVILLVLKTRANSNMVVDKRSPGGGERSQMLRENGEDVP